MPNKYYKIFLRRTQLKYSFLSIKQCLFKTFMPNQKNMFFLFAILLLLLLQFQEQVIFSLRVHKINCQFSSIFIWRLWKRIVFHFNSNSNNGVQTVCVTQLTYLEIWKWIRKWFDIHDSSKFHYYICSNRMPPYIQNRYCRIQTRYTWDLHGWRSFF